MICIQKIYGFHGINRQNIEKSWYVTPVTEDERRTDGRKVENRAVFCWTRNRKNKGLWKKTKNTGRAKPSFPEFANAFQEKLAVQQWQQQQWVVWPPVLKLKLFTFLKGINFTLQPTVCFNQVLAWVLIKVELCCLTGLSQYQGGNVYYINGVKCHEINVRSLSEQCKLWLVVGCN